MIMFMTVQSCPRLTFLCFDVYLLLIMPFAILTFVPLSLLKHDIQVLSYDMCTMCIHLQATLSELSSQVCEWSV